ncbi:cobN/Magnesium Chelatase family protein [Sphingomonas sp. S17]|uniref:Cobaltochelatase subunit CobN n=2 Tax=Sphingomonas paucimobilis TaxID=13689 RepID=A0A411LMB4_SPHPI|nr:MULTISPECIES: cobaltochelatase subunit CobN [Sphingomonas]EGI53566.1 cobN/Magnesium Chelatase family protein [Sphingomonas sp. S17]MBQ1480940.1 cobaltochelatase subunit CobN [Sphingomonas sp.]MCM3679868.1 cobaltochelatase subunit CobN [Sphingomonas paucimobilis]MDG5970737.1 cobaltochelatase subunit CobN [Sphingomonas paucimobilis]NNG56722.1 cobaltochelatase subunit CobN [Sphingomonas paucimobilis]
MHLVFRESHGLEEQAVPQDLGQRPGDVVVLSFSDSDLSAFAAGWRAGGFDWSLRLANLAALVHPLSVDTYVEQTLVHAKAILIRLIGGAPYWDYGLREVERLARERGIALAVLAADGREDRRLAVASTVDEAMLRRLTALCDAGGAQAAASALAALMAVPRDHAGPVAVAPVGGWNPEGVVCPAAVSLEAKRPRVLIVFYRAYLVAADLEPIAALHAALTARGFDPVALFVPSLKAEGAGPWIARWVGALAPVAIVNATAFSARGEDDTTPLDGAGVPVFQVALATSDRQGWDEAARGLSPADLAMHVVLPEIDGRLFAGVVSFKQPGERDPDFDLALRLHRAEPGRIEAVADRVKGWAKLAATPAAERRLAILLSTYPGKDWQAAHAVGLDGFASAEAILEDLRDAGYDVATRADLPVALSENRITWPVAAYHEALATLPQALRADLAASWDRVEDDPLVEDGHFHFLALQLGKALVALQPERGRPSARAEDYHDLSRCPRHSYVAFYLWLRAQGIDALVHVGAHGTLEWLPGKAVALSDACWPEALTRDWPVLYPFIVNDPGEAAQAKRRLGAVTIGHIPPALVQAETGAGLGRLEALLDEYANADGLDPARRDRLRTSIAEEAESVGLGETLGLTGADDPLARIDAFVCDVKDSQFGEGLHVFGRGEQGAAERTGLLAGLDGRRVAAGPSGSPYRGRADVLPTGRNLYAIDPRAVPSRAAQTQGIKLAEELIRRHMQEEGDHLRTLIVDLWGSATMRTAGEEFAMALHLIGVEPVWDHRSERVTGFEVMPLMRFDRPRVDVTLRVSGLFRDAFPHLVALFGQAVRALAGRDEEPEWNPYVGQAAPRVYGPAPGRYGIGLDPEAGYDEAARIEAGRSWLAASATALDDGDRRDTDGIAARVAGAQAFVHLHDLPESDLLLAADYAAHQAGFAAARAALGEGAASLYHLDTRDPAHPKARTLAEEIARTVHARAANPRWVDGMMAHGFRGAAEIAATLDHLGSFAHLADVVPAALIDLYWDATLAREDVRDFMAQANPKALAAMEARFAALHTAGLWRTRRNSVLAMLDGAA